MRGFCTLSATFAILVLYQSGVKAMEYEAIPTDAPQDSVMPDAAAANQVMNWAGLVFTGQPAPTAGEPVRVEVRRQDYNVLRFGQSCMETPIRIGAREFAHGLGTHANSEIAVHLPSGVTRFEAFAVIDNNDDTQGKRGSAAFSVEVDGTEAVRTPTLNGGDEPYHVACDVPAGAKSLVLRVDTTDDGPGFDQADWADACLRLDDGTVRWLDADQMDCLLDPGAIPFAFTYGQRASADLLNGWPRECATTEGTDTVEHTVRWIDPETSLAVTAEVRVFKRYGAVEWLLYFENQGDKDSPVLDDIQALDMALRTGNSKRAAAVRRILGDSCGERSFLDVTTPLAPGDSFRMTPSGGRSSNGEFPFFDVGYGDETLITAVGWSGQWAVSAARTAPGVSRLRAGMERTHLLLHPGESIRTPRILLMLGRGDVQTIHNRFRRLMLFHYVPQSKGRPVQVPVALQCFDRYSWTVPEWATEQGQIAAAGFAHDAGFDTLWLDAAWFPGGFPNGVGNWFPKPAEFPNGLKPVSDAIHANGMRFILWFEPERVRP
ncbi:MAG: NPCBM/NEW2 domain-containing protein, partial [Candidatus Hydrogenedentes bacterium]|nr:NPCBM/NEW2 domain-containing protein [Candidatus Hydrogenedentota bacterium]